MVFRDLRIAWIAAATTLLVQLIGSPHYGFFRPYRRHDVALAVGDRMGGESSDRDLSWCTRTTFGRMAGREGVHLVRS